MTFDNAKTIISLRLRVFIASIVIIIYVYFAYLGKELKFPVLGLSDGVWTLILLSIYAILAFYPMLFNYKYIYFSDDGPKIIFRFYSVGMLKGKRSSVEIPKNEFAGFIILSYSGGLKKIVLKRKLDRRIVDYPPIHLGSLKNKELNNIVESLNEIKAVE